MATSSRDEPTSETTQTKARVILQQCLSARLMVQPPSDTQGPQYVEFEMKGSLNHHVSATATHVYNLKKFIGATMDFCPISWSEDKGLKIKTGLIIYLCFLKEADEQMLDKMVKTILGARLSENEEGKRVSILELPGDILIIPQATLGGTLKGKCMQYHRNINKEIGLDLYTKFVQLCEETVAKSEKCREKQTCVKYGTYGNRQVFSTETNGPYTHSIEF